VFSWSDFAFKSSFLGDLSMINMAFCHENELRPILLFQKKFIQKGLNTKFSPCQIFENAHLRK